MRGAPQAGPGGATLSEGPGPGGATHPDAAVGPFDLCKEHAVVAGAEGVLRHVLLGELAALRGEGSHILHLAEVYFNVLRVVGILGRPSSVH